MDHEIAADPLRGFAFCTDGNVMALYSVAGTKSRVAERESGYTGIGSNYTEWEVICGIPGSDDRDMYQLNKKLRERSIDAILRLCRAIGGRSQNRKNERYHKVCLNWQSGAESCAGPSHQPKSPRHQPY